MLLHGKNAVIYGAGGAVGASVARVFAREGAHVFLTGRSLDPVKEVAAEICAQGLDADAAAVDALDEEAVEAHLDDVIGWTGSVDVSFNAIGIGYVQGEPLTDLTAAEFTGALTEAMAAQFVTATAAAYTGALAGMPTLAAALTIRARA